jgi:hypothetical protein
MVDTAIFWWEEWEKRAGNREQKEVEPSQRSAQNAVVVPLLM